MVAHNEFFNIKNANPEGYKQILSGRDISWIERGGARPGDTGTQFRLYRYLYSNDQKKIAHRFRRFSLICNLFFISLILFVFSIILIVRVKIIGA